MKSILTKQIFVEVKIEMRPLQMEEIQMNFDEVLKIMKAIEARETMGLDSMAGRILMEYAEELAQPILNVTESF